MKSKFSVAVLGSTGYVGFRTCLFAFTKRRYNY